MAKVSGPLFSLDARGQVGKAVVFSFWKGVNYVRQHVVPNNPKTADQVNIRQLITDATTAWKNGDTIGAIAIDAAYKTAYDAAASGMAMSGFNLFIKQVVALNYVGTPRTYDLTLVIPAGPTA